jgi:hypothetical protein
VWGVSGQDTWGGQDFSEEVEMEPWLSGTLTDLPVVQRALMHSLQMAEEDTAKWCSALDDQELHARPFQLPSVAFQLRHIARSLDRFCCYAEGVPLTPQQLEALSTEMDPSGTRQTIFKELTESLETTRQRLDAIIRQPLDQPIKIGRAHPAPRGPGDYNREGDSGTARSAM